MAGEHSPDLLRAQEPTDDTSQEGLRMDGWMDGRWTDGRTGGRPAGWLDGCMNKLMDEWVMDGWMMQRREHGLWPPIPFRTLISLHFFSNFFMRYNRYQSQEPEVYSGFNS